MVGTIDYNDVVGISEEEFRERSVCFTEDIADSYKFTKSDEEEIAKIERLLDAKEGTLQGEDYYLEKYQCECGRILTTYDFVLTGLIDAGHSKSLILHTFIGNKFVLNKPRPVRCSACGRLSPLAGTY